MVALIQRVSEASVTVGNEVTGEIGPGFLILLGVHETDTDAESTWLARKAANLRVFADQDGKMNLSLLDTGGDALVVSQFTLYGDARKGNRPSFVATAAPELAEQLYNHFVDQLREQLGRGVSTGRFGAMMKVALVNDGPVTLWLEKRHGD